MGPAPHPVDDRNRLSPSFVGWMMGFPPGWTEGMTRTQALKALGNAVVPQQGAAAFEQLKEAAYDGAHLDRRTRNSSNLASG
jgi:DNA (cytosine-5)-methyltransferase 1